MRQYLEFVADQGLATLGLEKQYGSKKSSRLHGLSKTCRASELSERSISAYQVGVTGEVSLDAAL